MVASDIVPCDAIVVDIVQDGHAGLAGAVDVELSVVWLTLFLVSGGGPRVVTETARDLTGGCHLFTVGRPEPSVDALGFEVGTVLATLEVADAAGCPDVRDIVCEKQFV